MNAADAYYEAIRDLLHAAMERERDRLEEVGALVARVIAGGGLVYVTGSGHAHMLAEEPFYRAGGLAAIRPILVPALMLHEGATRSSRLERIPELARAVMEDVDMGPDDALIVASNSGRNAYPVETALCARARRTPVVALTSVPHGSRAPSRHPSGKRLMDIADIVLDTGAPYGDATVSLGDGRPSVAPASTVLGAFLLDAAMARATQLLFDQGAHPDVFVSANAEGGEPMPEERLAYWRKRVPPL